MNLTTSSERTQTRYRIADLLLEFNHPTSLPIEQLLQSFQDFKTVGSAAAADIVIDISLDSAPISDDMGILRTDDSIAWGDRFRFYEKEDTFITSIVNDKGNATWYQYSSRNFEQSTIYVPESTAEEQHAVITWMAMMIFGQASLLHDTIMIHASVVNHQDLGIAFLGKSGTGKSTHSRLWLKHIPNTVLLNDDNPAIRITAEGVFIYGTPWSGKTPCYKNERLPLKGFVRLQQAPSNVFEWQPDLKGFIAVLPSCTAIRWNKELFGRMNTLLEKVIAEVPVGYLQCLPDAEAAQLCKEMIIGH
ncbi:hypothetical protein K7A41_06745 [Sphingobacterium sp. InxBP1]|uniref:hypothetical protein n=1 Tax=Sphingobacterium sp. InxBP1 TaxID=2870328 RepID=UPI002244796B|nr:hypothetical protein [Sphingobacterium sp. InxBP1]MCW8310916.1 hypothetical protein [Sphingobacterium sp. InxBP1]